MPEEMDDNGQKKTKPPPPQRVAGSYPSFRANDPDSAIMRQGGRSSSTIVAKFTQTSPDRWPGSGPPSRHGWKQPCLRPRLGIPPCRSSGGGWKTRFICPWQDGILLPIPARGAAG